MPEGRPLPPPDLDLVGDFRPAPGVEEWVRSTFLEPDAPLHNPAHSHLSTATTGFVWTTEEAKRRGKRIVGQAEIPNPRGNPWSKARQEHQLRQWFKRPLDFLVTLDAQYAAEADDLAWCALVEHELYHCGQAIDEFGSPKFRQSDGRPIWCIRGHDVEEFVGVVERYGADAGAGDTAALVKAGKRKPTIGQAKVAGACGTCIRRAA